MGCNVTMVKNALKNNGVGNTSFRLFRLISFTYERGRELSPPATLLLRRLSPASYARIITSVILNGVSALSACVTFAGMMIPCPAESFRGSPPIAISTLPSVTRTSAS